MQFGLIGKSLDHSFSPRYFTEKFARENLRNFSYHAYPLDDICMLPNLLEREQNIVGLNVTIPYKEAVISYVDEVDDEAQQIGAVNTIKILHSGKRIGYNTDAIGFIQPILGDIASFKTALILGTGGASKAVQYALKKNGVKTNVIGRNEHKGLTYSDVSDLSSFSLIVNCTPVGLYPNIENSPDLPYNTLTSKQTLYDLVYNPLETVFLRKGRKKGCNILNGYAMLVAQAEASWRIWNHK